MFKQTHVFRVMPDQELSQAILGYCRDHGISSGIIVGIIGSLKKARLNYVQSLPAIFEGVDYTGPLEIVACQGSVALKDSDLILHVHMQICDKNSCHGGHLVEAVVFSTAEVVIAELDEPLRRYRDSYTGLNEIVS